MYVAADDRPEENIIDVFDVCHRFIDSGRERGSVFVHWSSSALFRSSLIVLVALVSLALQLLFYRIL